MSLPYFKFHKSVDVLGDGWHLGGKIMLFLSFVISCSEQNDKRKRRGKSRKRYEREITNSISSLNAGPYIIFFFSEEKPFQ